MKGAALFGGCFNPIHVGHLVAAEGAREALGLERVVFVPAGAPPHKSSELLAPARHRLRMVELAVEGNPGFEVWDIEARTAETSFTIDTVRAWKAGPGANGRVCLIVGADAIGELAAWKDVAQLFQECEIVPVTRPGWSGEAPAELVRRVGREAVEAVRSRAVQIPLVCVSSSELRKRIAEGRSVRYLVPDRVAEYIRQHRLYRSAARAGKGSRPCPKATNPA